MRCSSPVWSVFFWLFTACNRPEHTTPDPESAKAEARFGQETAQAPAVQAVELERPKTAPKTGGVSYAKSPPSGSTPAPVVKDQVISAEEIELKPIVKLMLSRELFKLEPEGAQAYFANVAALQAQPADQSWLKRFEGKSTLPWLESALVELQEDGDHWRLGQSQLTWRPPKQQALVLYERLVAEVQAARGRKPSFARDESKGTKLQRHVGWNWCREACEAIVALDSDGSSSLTKSSPIDENQPAVILSVYTPEGP